MHSQMVKEYIENYMIIGEKLALCLRVEPIGNCFSEGFYWKEDGLVAVEDALQRPR